MKKILAFILAMLMMSVCAMAETERVSEEALCDALVQKSLDTTLLLNALADSEDYIRLYTSNDEVLSSAREIAAANYDKPQEAIVVVVADVALASLSALMGVNTAENPELFDALKGRMFNVIPSMLNSRMGVNWLATTSVLSVSLAYSADKPYDGMAYVFLKYAGDQPNVVCAYNLNGEVCAVSATYLKWDEMDQFDWSPDGVATVIGMLVNAEVEPDGSGVSIARYTAENIEALTKHDDFSIGMIGGADEPTSIFVSSGDSSALNELVAALESVGFSIGIEAADSQILTGQRFRLVLNGDLDAQIVVYFYESTDAAQAEAACINSDGASVTLSDGTVTFVECEDVPHYYLRENLIVQYVGMDTAITTALEGVCGAAVAGGQ